MLYVDIVFPVNLGPLTYRCPDAMAGSILPGMIVVAPLRNKLTKGIVLAVNTSPPQGRIKEISGICEGPPALSRNMIRLFKWMSEYYLAAEGSVIQQTLPKELFTKTKPRAGRKKSSRGAIGLPDVPQQDIDPILKSVSDKKYRAFLIQAPSVAYEYALVLNLLGKSIRNALIILPEVSQADMFYHSVKEVVGERACLLHGEIPKGRRSEALEGIVSGRHDIVIGTRAALFAPMKAASLVVVLHENCGSYKLEEGIRYHIRDVGVMRGFTEKATVVLSSVTPSIDSYFNALARKYELLAPASGARRPRMTIVDMRYSKKIRPGISRAVFDAARNKIRAGEKIIFVINRRGYSTLLQCAECGHNETCDTCDVPMVMHKAEKTLRCHYCGAVRNVPEKCGKCGSFHLELLGAGTQRIQEEIEDLFGIEALRVDSDGVKKGPAMHGVLRDLPDDSTKVMIGTKMMTKRIGVCEKVRTAVVLNADSYLNFPDFRATEKAYMELASIRELVEPAGELLIQTRFPQHTMFKYLRSDDYAQFVSGELAARKELSYPPFSKLLNLIVTGSARLSDEIIGEIRKLGNGVEALGPTPLKGVKQTEGFSLLLRSESRKALNEAARAVLSRYAGSKTVKITTDVDPV